MATLDLARQRTEMHTEVATTTTRYPTGKRSASRPKRDKEAKPKRPRRPRRWVPPGWDRSRWSARSIQPGGLETHHEPCMASFISNTETSLADTRSTARLAWLRPRNSVSIWEHLADVNRRPDAAPDSVALESGTGNVSTMATRNDMHCVGIGNSKRATAQKLEQSIDASTITDVAVADVSTSLDVVFGTSDRPVAASAVSPKRAGWPGSANMVAALSKSSDPGPVTSSCGSSTSTAGGTGLDQPAPRTPAETCRADRVAIMSLVNGP